MLRWWVALLLVAPGCTDLLGVEERTFSGTGGAGASSGGGGQPHEGGDPGTGADNGGGADGGNAEGGGGGGGAAGCPLLACGQSCVDPHSDELHCGRCDNACSGDARCWSGVCDRRLRDGPGSYVQCARGDQGMVCWGGSLEGQSGTGVAHVPAAFPAHPVTIIPADPAAVMVAQSGHSACALLEDGSVLCYGANNAGALGLGADGGPEDGYLEDDCCYVSAAVAPQLPEGVTVADIAAGGASWEDDFYLALSDEGDVYLWGSLSPEPTIIQSNAVQIVAGATVACALDSEGLVRCWGTPTGGGPVNLLAHVEELPPIRALGGGHYGVFAIAHDDAIFAWGQNEYANLGPGFPVPISYYPPQPSSLDLPAPVARIAGAHFVTCALLTIGDVYCWGRDGYRGDGAPSANIASSTPTRLDLDDVVEIAAGYDSFTARDAQGAVFIWSAAFGLLEPTELSTLLEGP